MNGLSVSVHKADQNLDWDPSDTIKHSLETSKHGSFRLTLNDESIIQNFHDSVQWFIWPLNSRIVRYLSGFIQQEKIIYSSTFLIVALLFFVSHKLDVPTLNEKSKWK